MSTKLPSPRAGQLRLSALSLALLLSGAALAQGPAVTATSPARHSAAIPLTSAVGITFNQAISAASATNVHVFGNLRGGLRAGSFSGGGSSSLQFTPQQAFMPGELLSVSVPATVQGSGGAAATPHVYQFRAAAARATGTFSGTTHFALNGSEYSTTLQVADLNGDGFLDLITVDAQFTNVSVRLGNGQGSFGTRTTFNMGSGPTHIVAADVNNDGKLDLVATCNGGVTYMVNVRLGDGLGGFPAATSSTVIPKPALGLVVVDVNGDGNLDMVTSNGVPDTFQDTRSVSVRLGDGTGNFTGTTDLNVGGDNMTLACGDVNNDGKLDLLLANRIQNTVQAYLGNGSGGFTASPAAPLAVGTRPVGLVLADLNGDGNLDAATANADANSVSVCLGNGSGGFAAATTQALTGGRKPTSLTTADVDGDGDLDLLVANNGATGSVGLLPSVVNVLLNSGSGSVTAAAAVPVDVIPNDIVAADLNNDGALDFMTSNLNNQTVSIRLNSLVTASKTARPALLVTAYPNPAREELTLELPGVTGRAAVEILGALGQRVRAYAPTVAANGRVQLPLLGLGAGMYVVRITTPAGAATRPFVVE